ncbi:MAG: glutamate-5-semialdehyde dehydrogenase [Spirosomataceae bacterium]
MNYLLSQLKETKLAARFIQKCSVEIKETLLLALAERLEQNTQALLSANQKDLEEMNSEDSKYDRLLLNPTRILALAQSVRQVALLPDPSNQILLETKLENGLSLHKMTTPLGVVGVIYESRPNVTVDVAALCLRSGNACVLKGGKEAYHTNLFLVQLIHETLEEFSLPTQLVTLLSTDRVEVEYLLTATAYVDILIPRGSDALIQYVRKNSLIPTIETGAGVCHTYIEETANIAQAIPIVINARVSRPSVCNSLDCVLIDKKIAGAVLAQLAPELVKNEVVVYADSLAYALLSAMGMTNLYSADETHFGKEWLSKTLTIKIVSDFTEALEHIDTYSSKHSEAILTENQDVANQFLADVDAAAVYHNASTRFTDGGVFGLGAEIGISTQKLHARGPFALEKLVTEKWVIRGNGQIRE